MKRCCNAFLPLTLIALLTLAGVATAQETPSFWEQLRNKLQGVTPQKKNTATTAVGGVRGAKDQTAENLYWKGEEKALVVSEEELSSFNNASLAAMEGRNEVALSQFQQFLSSYPQSALKPDALAAIAQLQPAAAAKAPAATKPESDAAPATPAEAAPAPAAEPKAAPAS
jgi:hypothetical protein